MRKKHGWFYRITVLLFLIFMGLYIASISGYYEARVGNKVLLTEEAMEQFEKDVTEGKVVDLNQYVENDDKDYSNGFTDAGDMFSGILEEFVSSGFGGVWDAIKVLFL